MNRASTFAIIIAIAFVTTPAAAHAEDIAIVGGTVHTEPGKVIDGATVVIRDGTITAVGKDVAVPAGATTIDATGKVVTAGFIDASSRLGLMEVDLVGSTVEGRFGAGGDGVHAAFNAADGYNSMSVSIPIARTGGVTSAVSAPRGGSVAGTSGWFSLADGKTADLTVIERAAMYAALGEAGMGAAEGSRGQAIENLREILDDAREYGKRRRNYERNESREMAAERLDLEALQDVFGGRLPVVIRAHRSSDILAAIDIAAEYKLTLIIEGGTEAHLVAEELAKADVGVILDPTRNLPSSFDKIHVRDDVAAVLADAGVSVAISTQAAASTVRTMRQLAGVAVANGMSYDDALAALTTVPAKLFGSYKRGRVVKGAVGDVVVWSGDPFELSSRAEHVIIGGVDQSLRTRQTLLLERYRSLDD